MMRFFLITLAILILISMVGYAGYLIRKVQLQKSAIKQAHINRQLKVIESVEIISKAIELEQCGISEGVLRLKPLMDILGLKLVEYPAMWELYALVETMPILEERRKLPRNERMKLDLQREVKEAELLTQIKDEIPFLFKEIEAVKQQLQRGKK